MRKPTALQEKMMKLQASSANVISTFGKIDEIRGRIQEKMKAKLEEATEYENDQDNLKPLIQGLATDFLGLDEQNIAENFMAEFTEEENSCIRSIKQVYNEISQNYSFEKGA